MEIFILFMVFLFMWLVALFSEKLNYRNIRKKEAALKNIPLSTQGYSAMNFPAEKIEFKKGTVVINSNFFKDLWVYIKSLFGANPTPYEDLASLARRIALLRLIEASKDSDIILNFRVTVFETPFEIKNRTTARVIAAAYGTAVTYKK